MPQRSGLESFTLKNHSLAPHTVGTQSSSMQSAGILPSNTQSSDGPVLCARTHGFAPFAIRILCGLFLAIVTLGLSSCHASSYYYYKFPQYTFANRPVPPSQFANRVMVSVTANGTQGSLQILDASRDIRGNIQNTITSFSISGYSSGYPSKIKSFPEQTKGYIYSDSDGSVGIVDYGKEASSGSAGSFPSKSSSVAVPATFTRVYSAEPAIGQVIVYDNLLGSAYALNLPNVQKVVVNPGDTVALAMVRNSNTLYRIVKLNANQANPPGAVDCQPYYLPVYCVVPVASDPKNPSFDRPVDAYFSIDGNNVFVLNCGPECGGVRSSVSTLQLAPLNIFTVPTTNPDVNPLVVNVAVPGGATAAISDGNNLYVSGQQLLPDGLFTGNLTTISLASNAVTGKVSISDGYHSKMLFADDNTLWIGSQFCATGERAKLGQNYNCLTRYDLGALTAQVIPNVTPGSSTAAQQVPYPNTDGNLYYYGSLTGLCWVQNLHKVYTAYGGQVHAFNTNDGSEINNFYITVQGTALDVAYIDAETNAAN